MKQKPAILFFSILICFLFSLLLEAQQCPDLVIQSIQKTPSNPTTDDNITVKVKVRNIGKLSAPPCKLGARWEPQGNVYVYNLPGIAPNATHTGTFMISNPTAKSYQFTAWADVATKVTECSELNNSRTATFNVVQACKDLGVTFVSKTPTSPTTADQVVFKVKVKNKGNVKSPACKMAIWEQSETGAPMRTVPPLNPNAYKFFSRTMHFNSAKKYKVFAKVDILNNVNECNENNTTSWWFNVAKACPDLTIHSIQGSPLHPTTGRQITLTIKVRNIGNATAPPSILGERFSTQNKWMRRSIPAIPKGGFKTIIRKVTFNAPRKYQYVAYADQPKKITECKETNNTAAVNIVVAPLCADLIIERIRLNVKTPTVGKPITFKVKVKNIGNKGSSPATLGIRFKTETKFKILKLPKIRAGGAVHVSYTKKFKTARVYHIIASADPNKQITECKEKNNTRVLRFTVR